MDPVAPISSWAGVEWESAPGAGTPVAPGRDKGGGSQRGIAVNLTAMQKGHFLVIICPERAINLPGHAASLFNS